MTTADTRSIGLGKLNNTLRNTTNEKQNRNNTTTKEHGPRRCFPFMSIKIENFTRVASWLALFAFVSANHKQLRAKYHSLHTTHVHSHSNTHSNTHENTNAHVAHRTASSWIHHVWQVLPFASLFFVSLASIHVLFAVVATTHVQHAFVVHTARHLSNALHSRFPRQCIGPVSVQVGLCALQTCTTDCHHCVTFEIVVRFEVRAQRLVVHCHVPAHRI